jgi:hypothetical protein
LPGARLLQQPPQWQGQQDQQVRKEIRAQQAQPEILVKMLTVRTKKDALRKHDEPKINELRMPALEIVTIPAAQAASTSLQLLMGKRAALGTKELTGDTVLSPRMTETALES